jgi:hypothetical protein
LSKRTTEIGGVISSMKSMAVKNCVVFFGASFYPTALNALQALFYQTSYSALRNPKKLQIRSFKTECPYK